MIHEVKILPKHFNDVLNGEKPFEIRLNDRDYRAGDYLALNEYDDEKKSYTGRHIIKYIKKVFDYPEYLKEGYVILSITDATGTVLYCKKARQEAAE